jgi:hypothetical protein
VRIVAPDLTATAVGKRDIRVDTSEFTPLPPGSHLFVQLARHGHDTMASFVHTDA